MKSSLNLKFFVNVYIILLFIQYLPHSTKGFEVTYKNVNTVKGLRQVLLFLLF
jgi:hypothetical protein